MSAGSLQTQHKKQKIIYNNDRLIISEGKTLSTRLVKNKPFMLFIFGQLVSSIGAPFTMIAMSWFVYSLTGSTLALGGVLLASTIPLVILRLFAGTLVDRWDRKKTMITTDILRTVILLFPVIMYFTGSLEIWHLYVANALLGSCEAFFRPAAFAILPNIVKKEHLVNANGMMNAALTGSMIIGPLLAGIVVAVYSAPHALLINAFTFSLSAITLLFVPNNKATIAEEKNFLKELKEGFSFFKNYTGLLWLLCLSAITNAGMGIILTMIVPYAMDVLQVGSQGYGMMQTAVGVGFIIGSVAATFFKKLPRRSVMIYAIIFAGSFIFTMMFAQSFSITLLLIVGFGLNIAIWNTYSTTTYQELVPDEIRGRVQSVRLLIAQGTMPIGMAIGAGIGNVIEITTVLGLVGFSIIISGIVALYIPSIHIVNTTTNRKKTA